MNKIDEILLNPDIGYRISQLKLYRGKYKVPDTVKNKSDWEPTLHEIITDKKKYPDSNVITKKGKTVFSATTGVETVTDPETDRVEANRISLPLEQDQINIHTAFTVGTEPSITCETDDDGEKNLLSALKYTLKKNFVKYVNKKEVRSWLSEQEVAEYWYATSDTDGFWSKLWRKLKSVAGVKSLNRPKCVIWSPFRGDTLYPIMDNDDMIGFLRGYKVKNTDNSEIYCYMLVTDSSVYTWKLIGGSWTEDVFKHGFSKIPIIYMWRPENLCAKVRNIRIRIEKILSQYADCIDYHFFPYLLLFGQIENFQGKAKNHIIQMMGQNASAQYLTWNQVPDTVKFEVNTLLDLYYSLTNTPRISFEQLKAMTAVSGVAFKFYFMGAHMAVENHAEEVGPFLQRRINFLVTALGEMNAELSKPSQTIDVETSIIPYMIDNISDKVKTAVLAAGAPIWDKKTGIAFVGNIDKVDEVYNALMEEQKEASDQKNSVTQQPTAELKK